MTHTNHRQGTLESLSKDYVVFMYAAKGINAKGSGPKLQELLKFEIQHHKANIGKQRLDHMYTLSSDKILEGLTGETKVYAVFDNKENAAALVKKAKQADLGISVIVSGLFDEVEKMCQVAGIRRHTAQCSLGVWGRVEKLPEPGILDITTMCGHAMVSFNLVQRMASEVKKDKISLGEAAVTLAKPCVCGVFNPKRAEELLKQYIAAAK